MNNPCVDCGKENDSNGWCCDACTDAACRRHEARKEKARWVTGRWDSRDILSGLSGPWWSWRLGPLVWTYLADDKRAWTDDAGRWRRVLLGLYFRTSGGTP
jgi:hypothetical protein